MVGREMGKRRGRGYYLNFATSTRQSLPMMLKCEVAAQERSNFQQGFLADSTLAHFLLT